MKLKTHLLFFVGFLFTSGALAEILPNKNDKMALAGLCDIPGGGFTLSEYEICAGKPIVISNVPSNAVDISYVTNYNGVATTGLAFTDLKPNLTFTYSTPAVYTILQKVLTNSGQIGYHCEKVKVVESRQVNVVQTACGGGNINIALTNDAILAAYNRVEINWGDGSAPEYWEKGENLNIKHLYSNLNDKYTIKVKGLYAEGSACAEGAENTMQTAFVEANLANIQITSLVMRDDNSLRLVYTGLSGVTTSIKYRQDNAANYTIFGNRAVGGVQPVEIRSEINKQNIYQLQLDSEDRCGGKLPSDVVSTMVINAVPSNGAVNVTWNKYSGTDFLGYDLYNGSNGELLESFSSIDDTEYTDTNVECGDFVSYYIVAKVKNATSQSAPSEGFLIAPDASQKIEKGMVIKSCPFSLYCFFSNRTFSWCWCCSFSNWGNSRRFCYCNFVRYQFFNSRVLIFSDDDLYIACNLSCQFYRCFFKFFNGVF